MSGIDDKPLELLTQSGSISGTCVGLEANVTIKSVAYRKIIATQPVVGKETRTRKAMCPKPPRVISPPSKSHR